MFSKYYLSGFDLLSVIMECRLQQGVHKAGVLHMWSSEPREDLTICRCHGKGTCTCSTFVLSYFKTQSVG